MDSARMAEAGHCAGASCAATVAHARGTALLLYPRPQARSRSRQADHLLSPSGLASAVERGLPKGWRVHAVVPSDAEIRAVVESAIERGSDRLVAVSLRPHLDAAFARPALETLYHCLAVHAGELHVETRPFWHDETEYVEALAVGVTEAAAAQGVSPLEAEVLFCIGGDASDASLATAAQRTAELVMARIGRSDRRAHVCVLDDAKGFHWPHGAPHPGRPVLLCPLDPFEDPLLLAGDVAKSSVIRPIDLRACEPIGGGERLVKSVMQLVRRGRQPAMRSPARVLAKAPVDRDELLRGLFMVGASVPGAIALEHGRRDEHCTREQLLRVKRPHLETIELLRDLAARYPIAECWIWNTCSRFEVYGWIVPGTAPGQAQKAMDRLAAEIQQGTDLHPAVLQGVDAWSHMMRTASGINSGLVGDADVFDQFDAALRTARHAGTAHERCREATELVENAIRSLRSTTSWGRYTRRYCDTALSLMPGDIRERLAQGKVVVVGGSTTSASSLESLRERFGTPLANLMLYYRGHRVGPLMDRLVRAVGHDHLVCVETYHDNAVTRAVADADVAILAADQREPFLEASSLLAGDRSPIVIDFNNFGSVAGADGTRLRLFDSDCVEAGIRELNHRTCVDDGFERAYQEAEAWIDRWLATRFESLLPGRSAAGRRQGVLA